MLHKEAVHEINRRQTRTVYSRFLLFLTGITRVRTGLVRRMQRLFMSSLTEYTMQLQ